MTLRYFWPLATLAFLAGISGCKPTAAGHLALSGVTSPFSLADEKGKTVIVSKDQDVKFKFDDKKIELKLKDQKGKTREVEFSIPDGATIPLDGSTEFSVNSDKSGQPVSISGTMLMTPSEGPKAYVSCFELFPDCGATPTLDRSSGEEFGFALQAYIQCQQSQTLVHQPQSGYRSTETDTYAVDLKLVDAASGTTLAQVKGQLESSYSKMTDAEACP